MSEPIRELDVDESYLYKVLSDCLAIPSPTGYTDSVVHAVCGELESLRVPFELTRRGAIRATLAGTSDSPARAVVGHLDTLGAMVMSLKPTGRLEIVPIGTWSARFAEGARVTVMTTEGLRRGSILPLKAAGHTFDKEVDELPVKWSNVELRVDELVEGTDELRDLGFEVGDFVSIDPGTEFLDNGFIVSRHLDDKAGVAAMLAAAKALTEQDIALPVTCNLLFTISEETGSGASAVLHGGVSELLSVDSAPVAPGQNSSERHVTIAFADSTGPFDFHLTQRLRKLCRSFGIPHRNDVFRYYRCDTASAVEAGNDIRTGLLCFGVDATHGYERTHKASLLALSRLLTVYLQSPFVVPRDHLELGPLEGFPDQPKAVIE